MDTLLSRTTPEERRDLFNATGERMGIRSQLVEKDFWVCWMLRRLFTLPEFAGHLTFKGGTSLSKAFGLIERFSEDIDLIVERSWLGLADEATGSKQQWIKKIKKACRYKINDVLLPLLTEELKVRLADESWELHAPQQNDGDPRVIIFRYPTVLPSIVGGYVQAEVKMEFNARSDGDPAQQATVRPYAAIIFPDILNDAEIQLRCLAPKRTFLEKATLLHEEMKRPSEQGVRPRLSRHFYDIGQMLKAGTGNEVMADLGLYRRVVEHRSMFFANEWMGDYSAMLAGPLILKPTEERYPEWQRDYGQMTEMFFNAPPPFEDVIKVIEAFLVEFNAKRGV